MTTTLSLTGGRVLTPDGHLEATDLHIADGKIVDTPPTGAARIDCSGYHVLPGIVDVHGDAWEAVVHPRPGVDIDLSVAMRSVDRQLLAQGITTAYHGLTLSWEPGPRSLDAGRKFMDALQGLHPHFIADHRVQIRWETFAHEAIDDVLRWMALDPQPAIAFNDHTSGTLEVLAGGADPKLDKYARRTGMTVEEYLDLARPVAARAPDVPAKIRQVAEAALAHNAPTLAHDEIKLEDRHTNRALGMAVSEFPMTKAVAADATAAGEHVVMGAPNVMRGGSHLGNLSAEEAVREDICTILASDYYYPSQMAATEHLVTRGVRPIETAWDLVSKNAAASMRLSDRGQLAPDLRADVVVVDCTGPWRVVHSIAAGTPVSFGR